MAPKPSRNIAQVAGSGTAAVMSLPTVKPYQFSKLGLVNEIEVQGQCGYARNTDYVPCKANMSRTTVKCFTKKCPSALSSCIPARSPNWARLSHG